VEFEVAEVALPEYVAVRLSEPVAKVVDVNVAMPEEFRLAVPN
jgi:hypothetical protein